MTVRFRNAFLAGVVLVLISASQLMASVTLNFAHIADGSDSNGVWTTDFSLVSMTAFPTNCSLFMWGDDGNPLNLATSMGPGAIFNFLIPAGGTIDLKTSGGGVGGKVVGGYARVTCDSTVFGSDTYTYTTVAGGPVAQVGVLSQTAGNSFSAAATSLTGFAIVNTNTTNTMSVTLQAFDLIGLQAGNTKTLTLNPLQHMAFNLNQEVVVPAGFAGSVTINASSADMLALAIGFASNKTGFVASAIPSINNVALPGSFTGAFNVFRGPVTMTTGTFTITDITPFETGKFNATLTITYQGVTSSTPVFVFEEPDFALPPLLLKFSASIGPFVNGGTGVAQLYSDGSRRGFIFDGLPDGSAATIIF